DDRIDPLALHGCSSKSGGTKEGTDKSYKKSVKSIFREKCPSYRGDWIRTSDLLNSIHREISSVPLVPPLCPLHLVPGDTVTVSLSSYYLSNATITFPGP